MDCSDILLDKLKRGSVTIFVKANSRKNKLVFEKEQFIVHISEKAQNNKANIALVRFLSKLLNSDVKIVCGFRLKRKVIKIVN